MEVNAASGVVGSRVWGSNVPYCGLWGFIVRLAGRKTGLVEKLRTVWDVLYTCCFTGRAF